MFFPCLNISTRAIARHNIGIGMYNVIPKTCTASPVNCSRGRVQNIGPKFRDSGYILRAPSTTRWQGCEWRLTSEDIFITTMASRTSSEAGYLHENNGFVSAEAEVTRGNGDYLFILTSALLSRTHVLPSSLQQWCAADLHGGVYRNAC